VKTVSQLDHPASNESKNGLMPNFPLYFLKNSFVNAKADVATKRCRKWQYVLKQNVLRIEFYYHIGGLTIKK